MESNVRQQRVSAILLGLVGAVVAGGLCWIVTRVIWLAAAAAVVPLYPSLRMPASAALSRTVTRVLLSAVVFIAVGLVLRVVAPQLAVRR